MPLPVTSYVDLVRYPIDQSQSPAYQNLVSYCRRELSRGGAVVLEDFIVPERLETLVEQADRLVPLAHHNHNCTTTPYQETVSQWDDSAPPRRRPRTTSTHVIAYDLIPPHDGVRLLYEWDVLLSFLKGALGLPVLHRYEDHLAGLNIAANMSGDHNGWHFDQCDFVTSLLIREAQAGGHFQYAPNIRSADNENYDAVEKVLDGDEASVIQLPFRAGSLALFMGRYSMHQVTPVLRGDPRLVALLGYDTRPGVLMSESARQRRFGRTH